MKKIMLVKINSNYCEYLRMYDNKIPYNKGKKELRPFVGILFQVKEFNYFAPLSSPKPKHLVLKNTIDFIKIKEGMYGAINLNNMIPVIGNQYEVIDVNKKYRIESKIKYQNLLKNQLQWINENSIQICDKALKLYNKYKSKTLAINIRSRCCDFILLEKNCKSYNKYVSIGNK